jgi:hypothetical protein
LSKDYVPKNDQEYQAWLQNFYTVLVVNVAQVGLVQGDLDPLDLANGEFSDALGIYVTKKAAAQSASGDKNTKRDTTQEILRPLVRRINNHPGMDDELRGALGLNIPVSGRATNSVGPEVPDIYLEATPGEVRVHFGTMPANERLNGKPSWAKGCNVYRNKSGEAGFPMIAFETASPFIDTVDGDGTDYTYVVRYRGTKSSDLGAGSTPATIAARGMLALAA